MPYQPENRAVVRLGKLHAFWNVLGGLTVCVRDVCEVLTPDDWESFVSAVNEAKVSDERLEQAKEGQTNRGWSRPAQR